jgi:predicted 2-oxoglutarate/Fe(II)-dependent dioxygenase YbiX
LWVDGVGMVSLPVIASQATALIGLSEQAPFGRGEDTVTDTSVRNCWQIDASRFALRNPKWTANLAKATKKMAHTLGLADCEIDFEPYKLLIYEAGSFFVRHRDTEKMPSMFATLVINLPSEHQGGTLVVSHGNESRSISFADNDGFSCDFAAFYADCYHEVKSLISGYRVCLVYNLGLKHRQKQPLFGDQINQAGVVAKQFGHWLDDKTPSPVLTYLLEHSYSETNFALDNLKGDDYCQAQMLMDVAAQYDCDAFLCLATYHRLSYGDVGYDNRYSEPDEDDFE